MTTPNYSTETLDRIKKLERMRTLGVDPFATKFDTTHQIGQIISAHKTKLDEDESSPLRTVEDVIPAPKNDIAIA